MSPAVSLFGELAGSPGSDQEFMQLMKRPPPYAVSDDLEARHPPEADLRYNEVWTFEFSSDEGAIAGWVRLVDFVNAADGTGRAWYSAFVVGMDRETVSVVDFGVPSPAGEALEVDAGSFKATHTCVEPLERWQVTLDSGDADGSAVALDLSFETRGVAYLYPMSGHYEVPCSVTGSVSVAGDNAEVNGCGQRSHAWAVRDWTEHGWVATAGLLDDGTRFQATRQDLADMTAAFGYVQTPGGDVFAIEGLDEDQRPCDDGSPPRSKFVFTPGGFGVEAEHLVFCPLTLTNDDGHESQLMRALCRFEASDGRTGWGWTEWNEPAADDA